MIYRILIFLSAVGPFALYGAIHPDDMSICGGTLREAAAQLREVLPVELERKILPYRSFYVDLDSGNVHEVVRSSHPVAAEFFREFPGLYPLLTFGLPYGAATILPLARDVMMAEVPVRGILDETQREMSPEERRASDLLLDEGWNLESTPEGKIQGQRCSEGMATLTTENATLAIPFEIKTPNRNADHNTIANMISSSIKDGGQSPYIFIDARGTTLSSEDAIRAAKRVVGTIRPGKARPSSGPVYELRIVADTYDYTWHFYSKETMLERVMDFLLEQ